MSQRLSYAILENHEFNNLDLHSYWEWILLEIRCETGVGGEGGGWDVKRKSWTFAHTPGEYCRFGK